MSSKEVFNRSVLDGDNIVFQRIDEIIPIYQSAFAGDPWFEVSRCPATQEINSCEGGISSLSIGEFCTKCALIPSEVAYPPDELRDKFVRLNQQYPMTWYIEENESNQIALAAFATLLDSKIIFQEKYSSSPDMLSWLTKMYGNGKFAWLDEVFADKQVRPSGNLRYFKDMIVGLGSSLDTDMVAYRTINQRMLHAAERDFGDKAKIYEPKIDVPDHRYFVEISIS